MLKAALGIGDDEPPEHFRIALAVLDLLSDAASDSPLLLVAEDAHWLDQPSVDVLGFVARRLESDPIVLLAAVREGYPSVFGAGELPELRLQPLDPKSATDLLGDSGRTGRLVANEPVGVEALQPAADVTIVELDERTVRFRHPLMRSAVRQSASVEQRRRVHEALAQTLEAGPDRKVWHRAALISGPHEDVSLELEEAARRARRRGAPHVAITALRRPVELRPSSPGHTAHDPQHQADTPRRNDPDPSDPPPPKPSTPNGSPATNPSTTAASTTTAHDHS